MGRDRQRRQLVDEGRDDLGRGSLGANIIRGVLLWPDISRLDWGGQRTATARSGGLVRGIGGRVCGDGANQRRLRCLDLEVHSAGREHEACPKRDLFAVWYVTGAVVAGAVCRAQWCAAESEISA